ncbi:MAG: AbrB/MazE/SpoVT family DNA-binding domain-containing protein [Candidatus Lokiarchaeota archaeon]|nr:AbrB/MazE/SpoVT family DNA-binding domain-containing protein [Candidatus Lokiarchaeota archaeon]
MTESKPITINKKGMITIPVGLREKYHIQAGSRVSILEVNGHLEIVPILGLDELRRHDVAEIMKVMEDAHDQEMRLENGE